MADFLSFDVLPEGSTTFGFDGVFGLSLLASSKKLVCIPLLNVSKANLLVRISLRSARVGRSQFFRASLSETSWPFYFLYCLWWIFSIPNTRKIALCWSLSSFFVSHSIKPECQRGSAYSAISLSTTFQRVTNSSFLKPNYFKFKFI